MLWDTHMHCRFSGDSEADPEDMIKAARAAGLDGICFTDHLDYDFPSDPPDLFVLDTEAYELSGHALSDKYKDIFPVLHGIETGVQPHLHKKLHEVVCTHDYDQVICSSHVIDGQDPYYKTFFAGREEHEAYRRYFESILENLKEFSDFDVYGHIDYVVRYGPNTNRFYSYNAYADVLDAILKKLIDMGKGIEINTGGFKYGLGHPNPCEDILKHYRSFGGEIITIGSDAHEPKHVAYDFKKVPAILREAGFTHYTVFKKRQPLFLPLPE
ncbi:MAG: histidinol-phosphatase HisJ family protein [Lachnospiraceae bacterium]